MAVDAKGPAFDANALSSPTPRKIVTCWMEQAGLSTMILPTVWQELASPPNYGTLPLMARSWWHVKEDLADTPFVWMELNDEQTSTANDVIQSFTAPCFPRTAPKDIPRLADARIIAESVAVGTEVLITGDINSIDHYEVNGLLSDVTGRNREYVTTLDSALCGAHSHGDAAEQLLILCLATVAPRDSGTVWNVDTAYADLQRLRPAMVGAGLHSASARLEGRWEHSRDLDSVVDKARLQADESPALRMEDHWRQWLIDNEEQSITR